jgi:hypothetical protein
MNIFSSGSYSKINKIKRISFRAICCVDEMVLVGLLYDGPDASYVSHHMKSYLSENNTSASDNTFWTFPDNNIPSHTRSVSPKDQNKPQNIQSLLGSSRSLSVESLSPSSMSSSSASTHHLLEGNPSSECDNEKSTSLSFTSQTHSSVKFSSESRGYIN